MATTKTRAELVEMAADELGLTSDGASLEVETSTKIDGRLDGLLGELGAREVVYIADADEIPVEVSGPLAELLANECAGAFGQPRKTEAERVMIEDRIKVVVQRNPPSKPYLEVDKALQGGGGHLTASRWARGY
jgi:hypothetical protein